MTITELTNKVQYLTDTEGKRQAVQVDLVVWEEIVTLLEDLEAERRWEELFNDPRSVELLDRLAGEAEAEIEAGRTTELFPDTL